jgi:L-threonylcarbamoyladenylate synthase
MVVKWMKTKIFKINADSLDEKIIEEAVKILKKGGLVVYPTETSYAIGVDATNASAIKKIYKIKNRDENKPIGVILSDINMAKKYGEITQKTEILIKRFMPGPLTIITRKKKKIPDILSKNEIAFRISGNSVASNLTKRLNLPITATSANKSGQPAIYEIRELIENFKDEVEVVIDSGNLPRNIPSTYLDMVDDKLEIRRTGSISKEEILRVVKK